MRLWLLLVFVTAFLSSCTYYQPALVSSAPLGPNEEAIDVRLGESSALYFLFFGPFGDDSMDAAVNHAVEGTEADTMMNVFVDRKVFVFPFPGLALFTQIKTTVRGTAVRYRDLRARTEEAAATELEPQWRDSEAKPIAPGTQTEALDRIGNLVGKTVRITATSGVAKTGRLGQRYKNYPNTIWIRTGGLNDVESINIDQVEKLEVLQGATVSETIRMRE